MRRAEVADGIKNLFFLVPDETIIIPPPLFNEKTTGEWHTHGMTRLIEDKHGESCYQVIEEAVHRIAEVRVALARIIPRKNTRRKHLAEFAECFRVMDWISHPCKYPGVVQGEELVVFAKKLFTEIGADRFTVRGGKLVNLAVQPAPDDLEIEQGIILNFMNQVRSKLAFRPCTTELDCDIVNPFACPCMFFRNFV